MGSLEIFIVDGGRIFKRLLSTQPYSLLVALGLRYAARWQQIRYVTDERVLKGVAPHLHQNSQWLLLFLKTRLQSISLFPMDKRPLPVSALTARTACVCPCRVSPLSQVLITNHPVGNPPKNILQAHQSVFRAL